VRLGFTGTRSGMTEAQKQAFTRFVMAIDYVEFHHGDCVGADADAHEIVSRHPRHTIIIHPPVSDKDRAFCKGDVVRSPKTYFARNRHIVLETEETVGCPYQNQEPVPPTGGTWYTLKYSEKVKHTTHVIWPDGDMLSSAGDYGFGIRCSCHTCR
jgi:hypothetical protein